MGIASGIIVFDTSMINVLYMGDDPSIIILDYLWRYPRCILRGILTSSASFSKAGKLSALFCGRLP